MHLLRLLVKLPSLVEDVAFAGHKELEACVADLVLFIDGNSERYFPAAE